MQKTLRGQPQKFIISTLDFHQVFDSNDSNSRMMTKEIPIIVGNTNEKAHYLLELKSDIDLKQHGKNLNDLKENA